MFLVIMFMGVFNGVGFVFVCDLGGVFVDEFYKVFEMFVKMMC